MPEPFFVPSQSRCWTVAWDHCPEPMDFEWSCGRDNVPILLRLLPLLPRNTGGMRMVPCMRGRLKHGTQASSPCLRSHGLLACDFESKETMDDA